MVDNIKKIFQKIKEEFKGRGVRIYNKFYLICYIALLLKLMYSIITQSATFITYFVCIFVLLIEIYSKILDILRVIRKAHNVLVSVLNKVEKEDETKVIKDEI